MTNIDLVLTDDWELRGDGSGDIRKIQFENLRALTRIYEDAGLRGSFNAEVMQQLAHLHHGQSYRELLDLANEWSELLCETYARGHDVHLHIHPQWHDARYADGRWLLSSDWTLGNHPRARIHEMVSACKTYLEELLTPLNPDYRCVSFRAGTWALAPSPYTLPALIDAGILVDISIAPGLVKSGPVDVDYREVDETLLPYYPNLHDARRLSCTPQPITCVPTQTFIYTPVGKIQDTLMELASARRGRRNEPRYGGASTSWAIRVKTLIRYHTSPTHFMCDLSALTFGLMRRMLDDIRRRCAASGVATVPVIITNHTKDLLDFEPICGFANLVAAAPDVKVITLSQLATNLQQGRYPVLSHARSAAAHGQPRSSHSSVAALQ